MATKTKAKPAAKKAAPAKKAPAKKATKAKAAPAPKVVDLPEAGALLTFTGYRSEMDADDVVFNDNDTLYMIEVDDSNEDGVLLTCIKAEDVAEYLENGDENIEGGQVAPSEVKELKGAALDKARDAYMPITMVGRMEEILDEADGDAILAAVELNNGIQESYFYMGGALAQVLQQGSYLKENGGEYEGDEAWNDFCQAEFGFKASKGRQLARIYSTFSALPDFDPASLAGIGWSIASKAEKYVTEENVQEVLEVAGGDDVTQRNIDATLKEKFAVSNTTASGRQASRGGDKLVTKSLSFKLDEDSAESVELALQQCMKQNGLENPALALERICVEWAQENVETKTAKQRIASKARKGQQARDKAAKAKEAPAKKGKK